MRQLLRRVAGPVLPLSGPERPRRLSECERCLARVVNPVRWHEHDDVRWWIRLRCGECGFVREVVVGDEQARRLEQELDPGLKAIAAKLRRLERARMAAEVDALALALHSGLIDADDFRHRRGAA
jgi:hypothetical protein